MAGDARMETISELCSFEGRLAGTDAERRAANRLADRLRDLGRPAAVEPTYVHPQAPLIWAAHCALAVAGSLIAVAVPAAGFALVLVAATSLYLDLNTRRHLLRLLFFRRASQNVVSRGSKPDAPARLLLAAHYDAARTGWVHQPRQARLAGRLQKLLSFPPSRLAFWSVAALLPMLGARMAEVDSNLVSALQLVPTLILLVAIFLLLDIQLSRIVPGANDNASGVALALALAERLRDREPDNLDVWILLTGAGECGGEGMRAFARSRRGEFDPATTFLLTLDSVGGGELRWIESEGATVSFGMDERLLELCSAIAEAGGSGDSRSPAAPLRHGFAGDTLAARAQGWRAVGITAVADGTLVPANHHRSADGPRGIEPDALDRAQGFALELIEALDRDVGRIATKPEPAAATG